jgi:integrase
MPLRLKLSWITRLKQWRKRYKGQTYYLGTGLGKTDMESYRKALAKWDAKQAELKAADQKAQAEQKLAEYSRSLTQWGMFLASQDKPAASTREPEPITPELVQEAEQWWAEHPERGLSEAGRVAAQMVKEGNGKPSAGAKTVGDLLDLFLADQKRRNERRRFLEAQRDNGQAVQEKPRENISAYRLVSIKVQSEHLRKSVGTMAFDGTEQKAAEMLRRFRADCEKALIAASISPNTFNERIKLARQFVGWLHENYHLQSLPRGLKQLCGRYQYTPTPKAMDVKIIQKLWKAASIRVKTWLALGLNVGFYAQDISVLKASDIEGGYLVKDRNKTGVPMKLKLWPVTQRLLELTGKADEKGYLFRGSKGRPLVWHNIEKNSRTDLVRNDFARLCQKAQVQGYSFSNLRDTSSTRVENIDPALTDLFEGHKDKRMARFYVDSSMRDMSRLDATVDRLEATYGLTLSDEEIKAWQEKGKKAGKVKRKGGATSSTTVAAGSPSVIPT